MQYSHEYLKTSYKVLLLLEKIRQFSKTDGQCIVVINVNLAVIMQQGSVG